MSQKCRIHLAYKDKTYNYDYNQEAVGWFNAIKSWLLDLVVADDGIGIHQAQIATKTIQDFSYRVEKIHYRETSGFEVLVERIKDAD